MNDGLKASSAWGVTAFALALLGNTAAAQLPTNEQKCLDTYNNKLRLVSAAQNKENRACVKNARKGENPGATDPEGCLTADPKEKVAGKMAKAVAATEDPSKGKCVGLSPLAGIYTSAAIGNAAHRDGSVALVHAIMGDPILPGTFDPADKAKGKCQDKVVLRAGQLFDATMREFRACKKNNLQIGTVLDNLGLEFCFSNFFADSIVADVKGKIAKKADKLFADIDAHCNLTAQPIATTVPGACGGLGSWAGVGACVEAQVKCKACETINAADGTNVDCDLFDDTLRTDRAASVRAPACSMRGASSRRTILSSFLAITP